MSDSTQSLTITAKLVGADDVVAGARKVQAAVKAMQDQMKGSTGAVSASVKTADGTLMAYSSRLAKTKPVISELDQAHQRWSKTLTDVNTKLTSMSSTLETKIVQGAKRAAEGIGALTAGLIGLGAATASQLQVTALNISSLTGMSSGASSATAARLYGLTNPVGLGGITQGYQQLLNAGISPDQVFALTKSSANISATKQDPSGSFSGITSSLGLLAQTNRLDTRTARQLINAGYPLYQVLEQMMPGATGASITRLLNSSSGILPIQTSKLLAMTAGMTGPLASQANGQRAFASQTAKGAFGEILKDIRGGSTGTGGIAGLLGAGQNGGPTTGLTAWLASFTKPDEGGSTPIDKLVGSVGPKLADFVRKITPPMEKLVTAASPLVPAFENFGTAIANIAPSAISEAARVVRFMSDAANTLSTVVEKIWEIPGVGRTAVDILAGVVGGLLAFKTVKTAIDAVKGIGTTLKDIQTITSGQGLKGLFTTKLSTMTVTAATVNVNGGVGGSPVGTVGPTTSEAETASTVGSAGLLSALGGGNVLLGLGIAVGGSIGAAHAQGFAAQQIQKSKGSHKWGTGPFVGDLGALGRNLGNWWDDAGNLFGGSGSQTAQKGGVVPGTTTPGTTVAPMTVHQTITFNGPQTQATVIAGVDKANKNAQDAWYRTVSNRS